MNGVSIESDFFDLGEDVIDQLGEDGILYQRGSERKEIRGIVRTKSARTIAPDTGEYLQIDEYYVVIHGPSIAPWTVDSRDRIEVRGVLYDIVSPLGTANGVVKLPLVEASDYDGNTASAAAEGDGQGETSGKPENR
ncbi:MAG TPA: hypothetical protein VE954_06650 [Oligoflexus sp.]|uniref:hypothetical protein n=1 Tax=Oligoflexus sp. TaxID=1971216 RepID=UPI002D39F3E1|nr:hypothetical protein [Oligoflexus sp.]HYX32776.1 hypothetical protein [Oligoflexus sp.]